MGVSVHFHFHFHFATLLWLAPLNLTSDLCVPGGVTNAPNGSKQDEQCPRVLGHINDEESDGDAQLAQGAQHQHGAATHKVRDLAKQLPSTKSRHKRVCECTISHKVCSHYIVGTHTHTLTTEAMASVAPKQAMT